MTQQLRNKTIEKLQLLVKQLDRLNKEIASIPVQGCMLVREDLGSGRKKRGHMVHGQKQHEPVSGNRITPPAGMGIHSDSPVIAPFMQENAK